jgi:hypothetical protein
VLQQTGDRTRAKGFTVIAVIAQRAAEGKVNAALDGDRQGWKGIRYLKSEDRSSCLFERALGAEWMDGYGWRMADGWMDGGGPPVLSFCFLRSLREEKGCGSACNRQLLQRRRWHGVANWCTRSVPSWLCFCDLSLTHPKCFHTRSKGRFRDINGDYYIMLAWPP